MKPQSANQGSVLGAVGRPKPALLLTILLLTMLEFLQSGMIAFAAGPIMGEIGAAPEEFSLTVVAYACAAITAIAMHRWLVERLGWRSFVLLSLGIFACGCLVCLASDSYGTFLAGRVIMALGGAAFLTSGRVIVNLIPPSPMRFVGMNYFATGLTLGIALGPGFATLMIAHANWRGIFAILLAVSFLTACAAVVCLPNELQADEQRSEGNPLLLVVLAAGSFLVLYALQRTQYDFFGGEVKLGAIILCGVAALFYFMRAIRRHERPFLSLAAFKHSSFVSGVALFTLCYMLLGANNYILPMLMQRALGLAWQSVGQVLTAGLLATILAWVAMALTLRRRPKPNKFFVIGFASLAAFGWQLARLTPEASAWEHIVPALAFNGIFLTLVMATTAMQTFRDVQFHETALSHAQQLKNMMAQFGMPLGISAATLLLQWRATEHYGLISTHFVEGDPTYTQNLQRLADALGGGTQSHIQALSHLAQQLDHQAMLLACLDYFQVVAAIGTVGTLTAMVLLLRSRRA